MQVHGGTNPGPPRGNRNARKHGGYFAKTRDAVRKFKAMVHLLEDGDYGI